MKLRLVVLLGLVLLPGSSLPVAQEAHAGHSHADRVPGTIDGAKTPELIPDDVAWRIFLRSVAEPPNATADETKRQKAKLKELDLSEADYAALRSVLATFHSMVTPIYARRVYSQPTRHQSSNRLELPGDCQWPHLQRQFQHRRDPCYPAHELYIGTQRIHEYMPPSSDPYTLRNVYLAFHPTSSGHP